MLSGLPNNNQGWNRTLARKPSSRAALNLFCLTLPAGWARRSKFRANWRRVLG